jgi:hypothetical protein
MDGFRLHAAIMSSGVAVEGMSFQVIPAQIGMPDVRGKAGEGAKGDAVGRAASEPIAPKRTQRNGMGGGAVSRISPHPHEVNEQ